MIHHLLILQYDRNCTSGGLGNDGTGTSTETTQKPAEEQQEETPMEQEEEKAQEVVPSEPAVTTVNKKPEVRSRERMRKWN